MDMMFLIKSFYELIKAGLWLPLCIFIIIILIVFIFKKLDKREKYLLEVIDKKETESKTDKEILSNTHKENQKSLMEFIEKQNDLIDRQNNTNNQVVTCIQAIKEQIKTDMEKVNLRLDYIEKSIDRR